MGNVDFWIVPLALFGVALAALLWSWPDDKDEAGDPVSCAGTEIVTTTASGFTFIGCPGRPFIWLHSYEPPGLERKIEGGGDVE